MQEAGAEDWPPPIAVWNPYAAKTITATKQRYDDETYGTERSKLIGTSEVSWNTNWLTIIASRPNRTSTNTAPAAQTPPNTRATIGFLP